MERAMWAPRRKLERCIECRTRRIPHRGNGLCQNCYQRDLRQNNLAYRDRERARSRRWLKNHPETREEHNAKGREWRAKSAAYKRSQVRRARRNRIIYAATKRKTPLEGIEIICECCGRKVKTPILPTEVNSRIAELNLFKELTIQQHQAESSSR